MASDVEKALDELAALAMAQAGGACWRAIEKHMPLLRSALEQRTRAQKRRDAALIVRGMSHLDPSQFISNCDSEKS